MAGSRILQPPRSLDPRSRVPDQLVRTDERLRLLERPSAALPVPTASPPPAAEGQVWVVSLGNGVLWTFRYNAASASAYKWEFCGGSSALMSGQSGSTTSATATAIGSSLVVPRAGDYMVRWGGLLTRGTPTEWLYIYLYAGDGTAITPPMQWLRPSTGTEQSLDLMLTTRVNGIAAGASWRLRLANSNGSSLVSIADGWIEMTPIRVS